MSHGRKNAVLHCPVGPFHPTICTRDATKGSSERMRAIQETSAENPRGTKAGRHCPEVNGLVVLTDGDQNSAGAQSACVTCLARGGGSEGGGGSEVSALSKSVHHPLNGSGTTGIPQALAHQTDGPSDTTAATKGGCDKALRSGLDRAPLLNRRISPKTNLRNCFTAKGAYDGHSVRSCSAACYSMLRTAAGGWGTCPKSQAPANPCPTAPKYIPNRLQKLNNVENSQLCLWVHLLGTFCFLSLWTYIIAKWHTVSVLRCRQKCGKMWSIKLLALAT